VIVDHIIPLADGGTHDESNLMPLCKRCHDGKKTPADKAARRGRDASNARMRCVSIGAHAHGLDMRSMRRGLARSVGWDRAHALTIAAINGMLDALAHGLVLGVAHPIIYDICMDMRGLAQQHAVALEVDPFEDDALRANSDGIESDEYQWLRARSGSERAMRSARAEGSQAAHASTERKD
jgi:hypothetical protein